MRAYSRQIYRVLGGMYGHEDHSARFQPTNLSKQRRTHPLSLSQVLFKSSSPSILWSNMKDDLSHLIQCHPKRCYRNEIPNRRSRAARTSP
jgi:hypothetical protein